MIKRHLSFILCLILITGLFVFPDKGKADGGTSWEKWFSTGTVYTRAADNITRYSAVLNGHVDWKNRHGGLDLVRDAHFKYIDLTDSSKGWQSITVVPVPSGGGDYSEEIHGLIPGHTYQFYTYLNMTSSGGHDDGGHCQRFTTLPGTGTPWTAYSSNGVIETKPVGNVGKYEAELRGHVEWKNRRGMIDLVRDAHFKYLDLTDSSRGWQSVTVVPVPSGGGDFSVRLRGLIPGHTYQYYTYLNMTMTGGHENSANMQKFTTQQGTGTPWSTYSSNGIVATMDAQNVTRFGADLKGHVEWQNQHGMIDLVRDAHFKYLDLTDSSKGWQSVTVVPVPSGGGDFTVRLNGLAPGHKYQFYAYLNMTVSGGHDDSPHTMTFTTLPGTGTSWSTYSSDGIVATMDAQNITQYGADLKGHVEWENRHGMIDLVRDAHFWYIDTTNPHAGERSVTVTPIPSRGGDFTAHLSGLVPGHKYKFYAYINMTMSGKHTDILHERTFTTKPGQVASWQPPWVNHGGDSDGILATLPVKNIGQYSADLSCHVEWQNKSINKDYITELGFCYDDGSSTGRTTEALLKGSPLPLHTKGGDYTIHLRGLQPGHTYTCYPYVEMGGTDSKWMSEAQKVTVTTLPGTGTPWKDKSSMGIISTMPVSHIDTSTVVLRGHVEWQNQNYLTNLVREAYFKYQDITNGEKDWKTVRVMSIPTYGGDFSATVSGLTKGHAYRFYPCVNMTMLGSYNDSAHAFVFTAGGGKPLTINATLPTGMVKKSYGGALTATGGDGKYTWYGTVTAWDSSIAKGDGLILYPNGVITGGPVTATPTSPQNLPLQVWATVVDGSGNTGSASFTIDILEKLNITTDNLPDGMVGAVYGTKEGKTVLLAAEGGDGRYIWNGTITPTNGLTLKSDGTITGTPQKPLESVVKATVRDGKGFRTSVDFTIRALERLKITTSELVAGTTGAAYKTSDGKTVKLAAEGGDGRYTWSGTIKPANGLTLKSDGTISGTPQSPISSTVSVVVSDGSGNKAETNFSLHVFNKLQITTNILPGGLTGKSYRTPTGKDVVLAAKGGDGNYTYSGTITPANGTLQITQDGKITGTPSAATKVNPLTVQAVVKDGSGNSAKADFKMFINDPLPLGIVGQLYQVKLDGSGGYGNYTYSGTITPANGTLEVTEDGMITGTPSDPTYARPLTVKAVVKDDSGNAGGITLQLSVLKQSVLPVIITTDELPEGTVGELYSTSLAAFGGDGQYKWSGAIIPANGLTLKDDGTITGYPQASLTSTVYASIRDCSGKTAKKEFTIRTTAIVTLSLADTRLNMNNESQLRCFFTVYPADANVVVSSDKQGTVSWDLSGSEGNYQLALKAGTPFYMTDTPVTITVKADKPGFTGASRTITVEVPYVHRGGSATAPGIQTLVFVPAIGPGIENATKIDSLSHPGAVSYKVCKQVGAFSRPEVGDSPPPGALPCAAGDIIYEVTADMHHLGVYALDASGKIMAFTDHLLTAGEVCEG